MLIISLFLLFMFCAKGIHIRDNYVHQNGRVGVIWSGGDGIDENGECIEDIDRFGNVCDPMENTTAGLGARIYNNHVEVVQNSTCYSSDGVHKTSGADTNENRGYNQGGFGSNVTMNTGHIARQWVCPSTGPYQTPDGEGVLHQCESNPNGMRNLWLKNDLSGGKTGYMLYYNNQMDAYNVLIDNTVNSDQQIGATFDKGTNPKLEGNVCKGNQPKCVGLNT